MNFLFVDRQTNSYFDECITLFIFLIFFFGFVTLDSVIIPYSTVTLS